MTDLKPHTQHIVPEASISERLLSVVISKQALIIVICMIFIVVGVICFPVMKNVVIAGWNSISALPSQQVSYIQSQIYARVSVDDLLIDGAEYADQKSLHDHAVNILQEQASADGTPPLLVEVDLAMLQEGFKRHPWIKDARIMRLQTGRLLVQITEYQPKAVRIDQQHKHWLIDSEGTAFVAITVTQSFDFAHLLHVSGIDAHLYVPELLAAQKHSPQAFSALIHAERLLYSGWKLWYQREGAQFYVYVHANNIEELNASLQRYLLLEREHKLSKRAVVGYDLRAWPKIRVEFFL